MRNLLKLVLLVAIMFAGNSLMAQQLKLGYINSQELISVMPEYDSAQVKVAAYSKELQDQLEELNVELNNKVQKFQKEVATYSNVIKAQKEKELQDLSARMQEFQQNAQEEFQIVNRELMTPVMNKADEAIKKVSQANGFTAVFDIAGGALLYYDTKTMTDILPIVKAELKITK